MAILTAKFNMRSIPNVSDILRGHDRRRRRHRLRLRRRGRGGGRHVHGTCNRDTDDVKDGGVHGHHRVCVFDTRSLSGSSVVTVMRSSPACRHSGAALNGVETGTTLRRRVTARRTISRDKLVAF